MLRDNSPEVVVEEKIGFDTKTILANPISESFTVSNSKKDEFGKISIVRNLSADTFNMEYDKMIFGQRTIYPYLNFAVNNDAQNTYPIAHLVDSTPESVMKLRAHRSLISDKKFHDLSAITVGYTMTEALDESEAKYVTSRFTTNPLFHEPNRNIYSDYDSVIHIKTIKAIDIQKKTKYSLSAGMGSKDEYKEITESFEYNNIFLVPRELKRETANKTLFDIYMVNDKANDKDKEGRSIEGDNRIISKKLRTTSFGKNDVDTQVVEDKDGTTYTSKEGIVAKKIARVDIVGRSFYDFDKKISVLGNNSESVDGEIIPYSLKGQYLRDLNISFNDTFKNMKIHLAKRFDQSILDPNDGLVKMTITSSDEKLASKEHHLNDAKIELIKKYDFSLGGLRRLSE